jgi:hypothetical protein
MATLSLSFIPSSLWEFYYDAIDNYEFI